MLYAFKQTCRVSSTASHNRLSGFVRGADFFRTAALSDESGRRMTANFDQAPRDANHLRPDAVPSNPATTARAQCSRSRRSGTVNGPISARMRHYAIHDLR